jgi:hypothetical protein
VPARQQQHARDRLAAHPARPATAGSGAVILLDEAARLRVLALAQGARRRLHQQLVERGAEAGGDSLVSPGDALPRLPLHARLPEPLLQLRVANYSALPLRLCVAEAQRGRALHRGHHRSHVPAPRRLQPRTEPLILSSGKGTRSEQTQRRRVGRGGDETHLDAHERVDLDAVAVQKRQEAVRRRHRRGGAGTERPAALHAARLRREILLLLRQKGAVPLHDQDRARFFGTKQSPTTILLEARSLNAVFPGCFAAAVGRRPPSNGDDALSRSGL